MKNSEKPVKKGSNLSAFLLGAAVAVTAPKFASYIGSIQPEQPEITRGVYQNYRVDIAKERIRTVVTLRDQDKNIRIHGVDYRNDGSIDMAEPVMGYPGTGSDLKAVQAAYDSVRKSN